MEPVHDDLVIGFSSQPSVADFLKRMLEDAGFSARAVWSSGEDLEAASCESRPAAIIYEIGFPLAEHWGRFLDVRRRPAVRGVPMVIATPASGELYRRVGVTAALDIFTRPAARDVHDAVRLAMAAKTRGRGTSSRQRRATTATEGMSYRVNAAGELRELPATPTAATVAR